MGNAHAHVINDTEFRYRILTFNYGDEIRHKPANVYDIEPFQTCTVYAEMCPIRGLVVATGVAKTGKHAVLQQEGFMKISTLLEEGDDNPAYEEAKQAIATASCTNLPAVEVTDRYTSVENDLKQEEAAARKKYNKKPKRVFRDTQVQTIPTSQSDGASNKRSAKENTNKSEEQSSRSNENDTNVVTPSPSVAQEQNVFSSSIGSSKKDEWMRRQVWRSLCQDSLVSEDYSFVNLSVACDVGTIVRNMKAGCASRCAHNVDQPTGTTKKHMFLNHVSFIATNLNCFYYFAR